MAAACEQGANVSHGTADMHRHLQKMTDDAAAARQRHSEALKAITAAIRSSEAAESPTEPENAGDGNPGG